MSSFSFHHYSNTRPRRTHIDKYPFDVKHVQENLKYCRRKFVYPWIHPSHDTAHYDHTRQEVKHLPSRKEIREIQAENSQNCRLKKNRRNRKLCAYHALKPEEKRPQKLTKYSVLSMKIFVT